MRILLSYVNIKLLVHNLIYNIIVLSEIISFEVPKHWGESLSLCMFKLWSLSLALTLLTSCEPESSSKTFYFNLVVHYFCSNLHETCILGQNKCTRNSFKLAGYSCFATDNNTVNITYQSK